MCLSQTKEKNHKDWLYSGFGNFYSKSCYFFDSNHITLKTYWDDTIDCNEQRWNKITSKKGVLSQTRGKNHKDWLYCGFANSYSKSCNFFDGYQMTLITFLDDTIGGILQCWSKMNPKNRVSLKPEGKSNDTIDSNKQC